MKELYKVPHLSAILCTWSFNELIRPWHLTTNHPLKPMPAMMNSASVCALEVLFMLANIMRDKKYFGSVFRADQLFPRSPVIKECESKVLGHSENKQLTDKSSTISFSRPDSVYSVPI
uniref:Secreted protein n=1 Tax=Steinernema glaseri TaxID=37863 RepID=A0A1I7YE48_9BILA